MNHVAVITLNIIMKGEIKSLVPMFVFQSKPDMNYLRNVEPTDTFVTDSSSSLYSNLSISTLSTVNNKGVNVGIELCPSRFRLKIHTNNAFKRYLEITLQMVMLS